MKFKKGQSDTGVIIAIVAFQAFIIIALGFIYVTPEQKSSGYKNETYGKSVDIVGIGNVGWTTNLISNISELGAFNLLIFAPIIGALAYIIIKIIRGGG